MTAVHYHLLVTAALAALFAVVVVVQSLGAAVRSSLSRSRPSRSTDGRGSRLRHRASRVADSRA